MVGQQRVICSAGFSSIFTPVFVGPNINYPSWCDLLVSSTASNTALLNISHSLGIYMLALEASGEEAFKDASNLQA